VIDPGEKIKSYLSNLFGEEYLSRFIELINSEPSQYIRINSLKTSVGEVRKNLSERYGIETEEIPEFPLALKVTKGTELTGKTLEHILGYIYIQGLSSMIPAQILAPTENDIVLDLCAAPGSKTTQLAEMMRNKGTLIANEIQLSRLKALVYNVERMNILNTGIVHQKGELLSKVYQNYFDKILVDAPCSGLGIIQKKEEVVKWWDEKIVKNLSELQIKLLVSAIKMLKPGGEIVYSTCTLTAEENEFVLNKVLSKYPVKLIDINPSVKNINAFTSYKDENFNNDLLKGKRILPWETNSDGFFVSKLRKTDETEGPERISFTKREVKFISYNHKNLFSKIKFLCDYFNVDEEIFSHFKFILKGIDIYFTNENWIDENPGMFERIGLKFGTIDNKGEIVLSAEAAQLFSDKIMNHIITLNSPDELKTYMEGGIIKTDIYPEGQYIIKYKDYFLGTAVVTKAGIKSRFPRSKRTQSIKTDI